MPTSTWVHISTICDLLWKYRPTSLLDIGPGFGRWGFLARELLDVMCGRLTREEWTTKICGVEIYSKYIEKHHQYIYDDIFIGCAFELLNKYKDVESVFDMVIAGDVLEHFEKQKGKEFINLCYKLAKKALIVCVPLGDKYPQGTVFGNKCEAHLAIWNQEDFKNDARVTRVTVVQERIKQRPYGIILYEKPKGR